MSYHLRRLRLRGFIERFPHTHRYRVTAEGLRTALFATRMYNRLLRPAFANIQPQATDRTLRHHLDKLEAAFEHRITAAALVA